AATLAVIAVADSYPPGPVRLVVPGDLANRLSLLASQDVDPCPGLAVEGVGRAHEHVVAELVQMTAVTKPRPRRRDVVRRSLAPCFDQHRHVNEVFAVPRRPGLHQLQPLAVRSDRQ